MKIFSRIEIHYALALHSVLPESEQIINAKFLCLCEK